MKEILVDANVISTSEGSYPVRAVSPTGRTERTPKTMRTTSTLAKSLCIALPLALALAAAAPARGEAGVGR